MVIRMNKKRRRRNKRIRRINLWMKKNQLQSKIIPLYSRSNFDKANPLSQSQNTPIKTLTSFSIHKTP
jgi:hypothetical protein